MSHQIMCAAAKANERIRVLINVKIDALPRRVGIENNHIIYASHYLQNNHIILDVLYKI